MKKRLWLLLGFEVNTLIYVSPESWTQNWNAIRRFCPTKWCSDNNGSCLDSLFKIIKYSSWKGNNLCLDKWRKMYLDQILLRIEAHPSLFFQLNVDATNNIRWGQMFKDIERHGGERGRSKFDAKKEYRMQNEEELCEKQKRIDSNYIKIRNENCVFWVFY